MTTIDVYAPLPDPVREAAFYDGVPLKRLMAWLIDLVPIALITILLVPLTAFTALFFLPVLWAVVDFLYRWVTLARGSATWGMRLAAIELRRADGDRLDTATAFLHVAGYTVAMVLFPLQLVSMALMLLTPRVQGLTDLVLGTVALRRSAAI